MRTATFKICIFGSGGVGKTTLIQRYVTGQFSQSTKMTIGVDIVSKKVQIEDWFVTLQIWDFGGEERFRFFLPAYARGSFGGVYMYDITRYTSLMDLDEWLSVFKKGCGYDLNPIPILMVGGKLDLAEGRAIPFEQAFSFAQSRHIYKIIECSAKTGQNVESIFTEITSRIMKNMSLI
ncbi:MAG: GTP-binding protein [Promethearchaeota archaeon]